jgi:hypothetical protein
MPISTVAFGTPTSLMVMDALSLISICDSSSHFDNVQPDINNSM